MLYEVITGFVTRDDLSLLGLNDDVAVYLPQSYNFAGNLIIVPRDRVVPIAAPASVVTALIVSGGISTSSRGTAAAVSRITSYNVCYTKLLRHTRDTNVKS